MFDAAETLAADLDAFARRTSNSNAAASSPPWVDVATRVDTETGRLILLLAAGKSAPVPGVDINDAARMSGLMTAARQVVSEVFLAPGADYFLNLGLSPDATNDEIREHFRRLMGIVHPDAQPVGFPADAAVRVNRAYGVLSSHAEKTLYLDSLLASSGALGNRVRVADVAPLAPRRPQAAARWSAVLAVLRSRQVLLWSAMLLLLPVVFLLLSGVRQNDPVRLVESRRSEPATVPPLPTASSRDVVGVAAAGPASTRDAMQSASASLEPASVEREPRVDGMSLTSGLSDRSLARIASARVTAPVASERRTRAAPDTSLAPSHATVAGDSSNVATSAVIQLTPTQAVPMQPSGSASDSTSRASPALRDGVSAPPLPPVSASVMGGPATSNPSPPVPPVAIVPRTASTHQVAAVATKASEIDDLLVRFASAYESGSITNFAQLFSTSMNGRRQMLREYERMFSSTQSRSIKFNQFKHNLTGERIATSGYATVTTIDQDNRTATQRVFLEFEIGRDRGEPRIERLSNYAIN